MKTKEAAYRQSVANRQRILRDMRETIRRAIELERRGYDQSTIARLLNAEGHTTRTGLPFSQGTVCHLIREFGSDV